VGAILINLLLTGKKQRKQEKQKKTLQEKLTDGAPTVSIK
jgi:preprotein translocase subunit YajC